MDEQKRCSTCGRLFDTGVLLTHKGELWCTDCIAQEAQPKRCTNRQKQAQQSYYQRKTAARRQAIEDLAAQQDDCCAVCGAHGPTSVVQDWAVCRRCRLMLALIAGVDRQALWQFLDRLGG
jgi:hypothetical protein